MPSPFSCSRTSSDSSKQELHVVLQIRDIDTSISISDAVLKFPSKLMSQLLSLTLHRP